MLVSYTHFFLIYFFLIFLPEIFNKNFSFLQIGKIFSVTTIIELLVPFATTPLYVYIYGHTINVYPCPVWFLSAIISCFIIIFAIIIEKRWKKLRDTPQYAPFLVEEN